MRWKEKHKQLYREAISQITGKIGARLKANVHELGHNTYIYRHYNEKLEC